MSKTVVISCYGVVGNMRPATLVFDTLRVGFPTASVIVVWTGALPIPVEICNLCSVLNCKLNFAEGWSHQNVVKWALNNLSGEVVLCDSDVIFWESVEDFTSMQMLAGRLIPQHRCEYLGLITEARLHPSLMFINTIEDFRNKLPELPKQVPFDAIAPFTVMQGSNLIFHDTMTNAYDLFGGQVFDEIMLNKYDHLFCSSFVDDVDKKIAGLRATHQMVYSNPQLAKGMWKQQDEYFKRNLWVK